MARLKKEKFLHFIFRLCSFVSRETFLRKLFISFPRIIFSKKTLRFLQEFDLTHVFARVLYFHLFSMLCSFVSRETFFRKLFFHFSANFFEKNTSFFARIWPKPCICKVFLYSFIFHVMFYCFTWNIFSIFVKDKLHFATEP